MTIWSYGNDQMKSERVIGLCYELYSLWQFMRYWTQKADKYIILYKNSKLLFGSVIQVHT